MGFNSAFKVLICVCSVLCHSLPTSCHPTILFFVVDMCWFYKIIHYLTYDCNILCLLHVQCFSPNHSLFMPQTYVVLLKSNTTLFLIYCLYCVLCHVRVLFLQKLVFNELLSKERSCLSRFSCRRNT
jgi:hypothetical protein